MKKILLIIDAFVCVSSINAQSFPSNLHATTKKKFGPIKKGSEIVISKIGLESLYWDSEDREQDNGADDIYIDDVKKERHNQGQFFYCLTINGVQIPLLDDKPEKIFDFKIKTIQDLWDSKIITKVLYNLRDKGIQNSLRAEMESDALEYINKLNNYNLVLNDPFLEYYLYSLVTKLVPDNIVDARPGNVNIVIVQDPSMNAGMFPNGTMVINTGLLARIHSEDELVAIMAHEIAHFLLDHSIINVNKAAYREARAEFWGAVLTGITAGVEAYVASNNSYYIPGGATIAVAKASGAIASAVNERLGMKYNHKQEFEADEVAVELLRLSGYNPNALASVFSRIVDVQRQERSSDYYFDSYDHPSLKKRIKKIGIPTLMPIDPKFEKYVSFAVTSAARMKFEDRRFKQALAMFTQNVVNGVATSDDYLLRANCLLALYNSPDKNKEVMEMVAKAKEIDPNNINVYKTEILGNLRMENKGLVVVQLREYIDVLTEMITQSKWKEVVSFAQSEKTWANNMLSKLRGL